MSSNAIFHLGGIDYLATTKRPVATLPLPSGISTGASLPFAVLDIECANGTITQNSIESTIASYLQQDDVFTDDFLDSIFVTGGASIDGDALKYVADMGART